MGTPLGSASILEHLQSLLKQKEGELLNSQDMVLSLERSRSSITEELAHATTNNEKLKREVDTIPTLKQKLQVIYLSIYIYIYIYISDPFTIHLSIHPSIHPFTYPSIYLSIHSSIHPPVDILQEVSQKYEALLQMFGEKVEEAEELRLDIQDLKSMYRQQVSISIYLHTYTFVSIYLYITASI